MYTSPIASDLLDAEIELDRNEYNGLHSKSMLT